MRNIPIVTGEIYHICNRSTEGLKIFEKPSFAGRFIKTLHECNSTGEGVRGFSRHPRKLDYKHSKQQLVDVLAVVIMPNHFHLLVRQVIDDGIAHWLHRSCTSFARTYNLANQRKGTLFMGRFKAVRVVDDSQLFHLMAYIHANPLDLVSKNWRLGQLDNWVRAKKFLVKYQWSSLGAYNNDFIMASGIRNLVNAKETQSLIAEWESVERGIKNWSERSLEDVESLILE